MKELRDKDSDRMTKAKDEELANMRCECVQTI